MASGNSINPCRQLGLPTKTPQPAKDRHEHVLGRILALLQRHTKRTDETKHRLRVAFIERPPRKSVPLANTFNQRLVFGETERRAAGKT